jgi:hypothetical protein
MTDSSDKKTFWRFELAQWAGDNLLFNERFLATYGSRVWSLSSADHVVAHALHVELISRITTQPLGYNEGSEVSALKSVHSLFAIARELTTKSLEAYTFETIVWHVLNTFVRPFTAKWHLVADTGELRALDSSDVFRAELATLQKQLVLFDAVLAKLGNGAWYSLEAPTRPLDDAIISEMKNPVSWKPMGEPSSVAVTRPRDPQYADALTDLATKERAHVKERRQFYGVKDEVWASGIALSGGGIRSATFAMGVLVSLGKRNLLRQFDYLSTVSGGGYTGSFLTQLIGSTHNPDNLSLSSSDLPFKRAEGESYLLQRVRHGASFLSASPWERFSVALAQAQGILINVLLLVTAISFFAGLQVLLGELLSETFTAFLATGLMAAFILWSLIVPVVRKKFGNGAAETFNRANSYISATLLLFPLWGLLQLINQLTTSFTMKLMPEATRLAAFATMFLISLTAIFAIGCAVFIGFSRIRPLLLTTLTVLFVFLCEEFLFQILNSVDGLHALLAVAAMGTLGLTLLARMDINATSLHHYYRQKLSKAFILDRSAEPVKAMRLSEFVPQRALFPIINCALNVPGSTKPEMRGRHADLFSLTPVSGGATLINQSSITDWERQNPDLDLATAMALSGAAVSPQMGLRTTRYSSFWLTFLNLRLNLWLKKPTQSERPRGFPNLANLRQELLATADEDNDFVNISDGGHIENLGVYELLRRRCRFIVAVDGENDGQMTFHALTNLQRLAYIDHGIVIEANLEDLRLGEKGFSRSHFRFCRIRYPSGTEDREEEIGYLIYLKLSLTGNEGEFIRRYKFDEPAFPHHPTANQLFTEVQFEAYRALGEHVGEKMFLTAITGLENENSDVLLEDWFYGLGKSFLEPLRQPRPGPPSKTTPGS